jgi:chemotaxis protein MotB
MKKRKEEHVNHERWLISYSDFITLLFALFVILYATSKSDTEKFKKIAESMARAFGNVDMSVNSHAPGAQRDGSAPSEGGSTSSQSKGGAKVEIDVDGVSSKEDPALEKLAEAIEAGLQKEFTGQDFSDRMQIDFDDRGLVVRLAASYFFEPGTADVKVTGLAVLDPILNSIKSPSNKIRIEGHTDNSKIASELYPSNWELSAARAAFLARYMIQKRGFDPLNIEVAGMAEFHPIASNDSPVGQAKNRRIEIVVLRQKTAGKTAPNFPGQ